MITGIEGTGRALHASYHYGDIMRYLIALAAVALLASCSDSEEELPGDAAQAIPSATVAASLEPAPAVAWTAPSGTPVPKPGWKTVRFLNLTVSVPAGIMASPLAGYTFSPTDYYNRPVIEIAPVGGSDSVRVVLDAETGALVAEAGSEGERAALQPALDTVRVSPFDPKTAPWPYADTAPPDDRGVWWKITYPIPDVSTGIDIDTASGIGAPDGVCQHTIVVSNGRSRMVLDACTGEPISYATSIDPADAEALERFRAAVVVEP